MRPTVRIVALTTALSALTAVTVTATEPEVAAAAFPGANGVIAVGTAAGQISTVRADGQGRRALTGAADYGNPAWSPDGTRLAYETFDTERGQDIVVADADGSNPRAITEAARFPYRSEAPAWSPDGQRLVFVGTTGTDQLWTVRANGTGLQRITSFPDTGFVDNPVWSPDGRTIAFDRFAYLTEPGEEPKGEIAVVDAGGSNLRVLGAGFAPDFSPDGSRIVFQAGVPGAPGDSVIRVMRADGTAQRTLADRPGRADLSPAWSPDGRMIAFVSQRSPSTALTLWTMRADGSGQRQVTAASAQDRTPSWQPLLGG